MYLLQQNLIDRIFFLLFFLSSLLRIGAGNIMLFLLFLTKLLSQIPVSRYLKLRYKSQILYTNVCYRLLENAAMGSKSHY